LVNAGARVIYFWEGQQVLCTDLATCESTPGWKQHISGQPFAFGPPMAIGTREFDPAATQNGAANANILEPLCINPSSPATGSDDAGKMIHLIRNYSAGDNPNLWHLPDCYPPNTDLPQRHLAPVVQRLDGYLTYSEEDNKAIRRIFADDTEVYTLGEPLTARSDAERVNYLLFTHYLAGEKHMEASMNLLAMDFVHPAVVHRIIASSQGGGKCGGAILCLDSGGCFAADLRGSSDSGCMDKHATEVILMDFAENRWMIGRQIIYYTTYAMWIAVIGCCCAMQFKPLKAKAGSIDGGRGDGGIAEEGDPPTEAEATVAEATEAEATQAEATEAEAMEA